MHTGYSEGMEMEENLIKRAKKYDREAQSELYAKYKSYWYALCMRYQRNENEAQDALQESLIKIFSRLEQFDRERGSFKSWSGRVVINQCLVMLRKRRPLIADKDVSDYYGLAVVEESPIEILSAKEIKKLIRNLPEGYRLVFNLYVIDGYKHREIARLLNIKVGTSKSQLFKAKKALREQLEVLLAS